MDATWTWELPGYCVKYGFLAEPKGLTISLRLYSTIICAGFPFSCTAMKIGLMAVFAVSCCGRGWIAMTQNAFWTIKWAVYLPCWIVSGNTIPHKGQIF